MAKDLSLNGKTTSAEGNSFSKGLVKDISDLYIPTGMWTHARNAVNVTEIDGDIGTVSNESANDYCSQAPYTIIGTINIYKDYWVIYSTDDTNSEIGLFDESACQYYTIVNDPCLSFNRNNLAIGRSRENFDCSFQVYWSDGLNPDRTLNIGDVRNAPFIQPWPGVPYVCENQQAGLNEECQVCEPLLPLQLDCEKIRLAKLTKTPCVTTNLGLAGGNLRNGSYYSVIAYAENGQKATTWSTPSNIQSIFNHDDNGGSLQITLSNVETDNYDEFILAIVRTVNNQLEAKQIGLYSTDTTFISIDYLDPELPAIDIKEIPVLPNSYEKSNGIYQVNNYLLRVGPTSRFDFNYQPLANQIDSEWVMIEQPPDYYRKGGNVTGYMRDEQYAFFIRWVYNTGDKTSSYHIPGRGKEVGLEINNNGADILYNAANGFLEASSDNFELAASNALQGSYQTPAIYDVINTAYVTESNLPGANDPVIPGQVIASGKLGYWESTEIYPDNKPEIWNASYWPWSQTNNSNHDLCGKPIRHHKFPADLLNTSPSSNGIAGYSRVRVGTTNCLNKENPKAIRVLGARFKNIKAPVDNEGNPIVGIVGYEILRSSREGNKTVIAKGIVNNVRSYKSVEDEDIYFQNYPYNDLSSDPFIDGSNTTHYDKFTFHSPDTNFTNPFLNQSELRLYGEVGQPDNVRMQLTEVPGHPKHKLITDLTFLVGFIAGLGIAGRNIRGKKITTYQSPEFFNVGVTGLALGTGAGVITPLSAAAAFLQPGQAVIANAAHLTYEQTQASLLNWIGETVNSEGNVAELALTGALNGVQGGGIRRANTVYQNEYSDLDYVGNGLRLLSGAVTFGYYLTEGADKVIEIITALSPYRQYAHRYLSVAHLHNHTMGNARFLSYNTRRYISNTEYLDAHYQNVDGDRYNNLNRARTVALHVHAPFLNQAGDDNTRVRITEVYDDWDDRSNEFCRTSHSYYSAIKIRNRNQYGQLGNIKQIFTGCMATVPANFGVDNPIEQSPDVFGGDVYIGRYTEKNTFFYFYDWLYNQPDGYEFDYTLRYMINKPEFWANFNKFATEDFIRGVIQSLFNLDFSSILSGAPSNLHNLDDFNAIDISDLSNSEEDGISGLLSNLANKLRFIKQQAVFYLFNSGVRDFFVESEYNVDSRDWAELDEQRHYDPYRYTDLTALFDTKIIKFGNYYKYDRSLSVGYLPSNKTSWGTLQPLWYNPLVAASCFTYYPDRVIYSLPQNQEGVKDFWKIYLVNNYEDFGDVVTSIKPISKSGSMVLFESQSPILFAGVDQLETTAGVKLTIGDGGLFSQPLQNLSNAEPAYQHGSCQNRLSVINTPVGLYYISQSQGKVFKVGSDGITEISASAMRSWFTNYLPYKILEDFPEFELTDNPVVGVGCQSVYDNRAIILYFCKKDYKLKKEFQDRITYVSGKTFLLDNLIQIELGNLTYFDNASWTISYDPKNEMWISFHDWHPELTMAAKNNMLTTVTNNGGQIWRHNDRSDLFCNFYGQNYPFEIEQTFSTGQVVNTVRSIEYMLEAYIYNQDTTDRYHVLDGNFDRAVIHNSEQVSGVLKLNLSPKNNSPLIVSYPQINPSNIDILYSKEEQKYRFNQFWDVTADRGEFTFPNVQRLIWTTEFNGYIRALNPNNLNYNKSPFERKKFRHYTNRVLLYKMISGNIKLIYRLINTKLLYSSR
jgi:hypothetical protein